MSNIGTVGVVGAGTMGSGIAQVFAQAGLSVELCDSDPGALDRARQTIAASLERLAAKGAVTPEAKAATLERVRADTTMARLGDADFIVEAIVEDAGAKASVLSALDALVPPDVILATNTSSISITRLGASTRRPDRVVGMHFMNPVPVMTLVEIVRGQRTSDATMAATTALCERLGKTPVEAADYPGFIANRVLMPMINEAIYAVMEGVGTPDAIDTVMKLGMRHPMGPLTLADFIGLDVCLSIMDVLHDGFGDPKYRACPLLRRLVAAGHLGRKSGQGFHTYDRLPES